MDFVYEQVEVSCEIELWALCGLGHSFPPVPTSGLTLFSRFPAREDGGRGSLLIMKVTRVNGASYANACSTDQ